MLMKCMKQNACGDDDAAAADGYANVDDKYFDSGFWNTIMSVSVMLFLVLVFGKEVNFLPLYCGKAFCSSDTESVQKS